MSHEGPPQKNESLTLPDVNQAARVMDAIIAVGRACREYRESLDVISLEKKESIVQYVREHFSRIA